MIHTYKFNRFVQADHLIHCYRNYRSYLQSLSKPIYIMSCRQIAKTDESTASAGSSLNDRDETIALIETGTTDNQSSDDNLRCLLYTRPIVTTAASSSALMHQGESGDATQYRRIGFGQCGLIFEHPGRIHAIKLARVTFRESLWDEWLAHAKVAKAFKGQSKPPECLVPRLW